MDVLFDNRLNTFQATCDFAGYMACFQRRALLPTCTQIGKLLYGIDSTLTASTALRISFSMQFTAELIGQFAVLVDILCGLTRPDDGTWKGKFDAFVQKSPISKIPELLNFLIFDSTEYSAAFVNYGNIGFDWLNTLKQSPQPQTQLCTLMFGTNTNEEDNRLKILIQEHVDQLDAVFSRLINQFKKGVRGTVEFIASLNRKLQSLLPSDSLQKRIFQESCAIAQQVSNTKEHRLSVEAKDLLKELSGATH